MTITEQPPADLEAAASQPEAASPSPAAGPAESSAASAASFEAQPAPRGVAALLSTGDSALLGRLWIFFGIAFGAFTFIIGMLLGAERLGSAGIDIFSGHRSHFQFFTLYRVCLVLLCVVPLFIGLATAVVPKQIGARSVAYPRLAAAAFYTWLVAACILLASWGIDGGLVPGGQQEATELSLLSIGLLAIALTAAAVTIIGTVILQRSEQFQWLPHVPFFSWGMLVASGIWVVSFPVLLADVVVMWVDARGATAVRYGVGENLFAQIAWIFDQQQVFAWSLPVLGIMGDALVGNIRANTGGSSRFMPEPEYISPVQGRTQGTAKFVLSLMGIVAFGGALNGFYTPGYASSPVFVVAAFLVVLIILALARPWAQMAKAQPPRITPQLAIALMGFLLLLGAGVLASIRNLGRLVGGLRIFSDDANWLDNINSFTGPFDDLAGTTAASAVLHAALLAALLSIIAGLYMWSPVIFGKKLASPVGALSGLLILGGTLLYCVSELVSGFLGQMDRPAASAAESAVRGTYLGSGIEAANTVSFLGTIAILAGFLFVALNLLAVLRPASVPARSEAASLNLSA